jgi:hypothetical protein
MEPTIYSFSLCTALPLMLFFGFYFLFAKTPEKKIFKNYLRSRQIMGIAMLLLSANYSVHFFFGIRFKYCIASPIIATTIIQRERSYRLFSHLTCR